MTAPAATGPAPNYLAAAEYPEEGFTERSGAVDGVHASIGREMYGPSSEPLVSCPYCLVVVGFDPKPGTVGVAPGANAQWDDMMTVVDRWYATGEGTFPCPSCGRPAGLNEWRWSPAWAFGCLAITFWNWPPLRGEFVTEVSRRLGHRTISLAGKL